MYQLARHRNAISRVIPERVIARAPSAELAPDQEDQDSLPPYTVLDPILEAFVEDDRTLDEIVAMGYDEAEVRRVMSLVLVSWRNTLALSWSGMSSSIPSANTTCFHFSARLMWHIFQMGRLLVFLRFQGSLKCLAEDYRCRNA